MAQKPTDTETMTPPPTMKAEISKQLDPGEHRGLLKGSNYRKDGEQQFPYVDIVIVPDDAEFSLKAGYPANKVTTRSAIGQLLTRFGFDVEAAAKDKRDVDWSVLNNRRCIFTTTVEETAKGKFTRVELDTVRPDDAAPNQRRR